MNLGRLIGDFIGGSGGLPMPPMPPGLPNPFGGGGSGMGGGGMGGGGLGGTTQTMGGGDLGYPQNIAGLLQMLGGNQNQPNANIVSGGGLI